MQTTSNGYFDITIRNKYDSVNTKRKGRKESLMSFFLTLILCGSLMIFSNSVSSSSEVASEDIKGKSEVFPTSTPEAKQYMGAIYVASTTSDVDTQNIKVITNHIQQQENSAKIVSVTNKSSENQNETNTNVTGSSITIATGSAITPLSVSGEAISVSGSAIQTLNENEPNVTINQSEEKSTSEVALTPSQSSEPKKKEVKQKTKKKQVKKRMKYNVKTSLSGKKKERADFIATICLNNWKKYGVLPSTAIGQAFVESTIGEHCRGYNLWGINSGRGYNYSSLREGTLAYLKVINNGYYDSALFCKNPRTQIRRILSGGYCVPIGDYYSQFTWALDHYNLEEYDRQMFEILRNRK